jgi:hypothetical protein
MQVFFFFLIYHISMLVCTLHNYKHSNQLYLIENFFGDNFILVCNIGTFFKVSIILIFLVKFLFVFD